MGSKPAYEAPELTAWNKHAAKVICDTNGLILTARRRQRSIGRNNQSRYIWFGEKLSPYVKTGYPPRLKLKPRERTGRQGRVSIEIRNAKGDKDLRARAEDIECLIDATSAGTLVLSLSTERLKTLDMTCPVEKQEDALRDAAHVAKKLIDWWEHEAHSIRPVPPSH